MQQNIVTDTNVDSTAERLPYAAPTLEQLDSQATQGKPIDTTIEHGPMFGS